MIGDIIRKYRLAAGLTQEEMARRLGVTTPAVNKWEKNNTQPDISLLAPIARLFGITTDELLSYREELTAEEIRQWVKWLDEALEEQEYAAVFAVAEKKLQEYPSCYQLIWQTAVILDAGRLARDVPEKEKYEPAIMHWYEECLEAEDEALRNHAVGSLFEAYIRKEEYAKAEKYISNLSQENPERKRMQALVYSRTGKREDAFRMYEELLFSDYQRLQLILSSLYMMYMEDSDYPMAHKLVDVEQALAGAFEMGRYHEISTGLELAAVEKDVNETEKIMRGILENIDTITDFRKSTLYQHMSFREPEAGYEEKLRQDLISGFQDDASFGYMKGNAFWERLKGSNE